MSSGSCRPRLQHFLELAVAQIVAMPRMPLTRFGTRLEPLVQNVAIGGAEDLKWREVIRRAEG